MAKSSKKQTQKQTKVIANTVTKATVSKRNKLSINAKESGGLLYGRDTYKLMLIGIGLIALGMILMMGGSMPSPDVWDESIIYSPVRTVISPILILAGLAMQFVAIFKKSA